MENPSSPDVAAVYRVRWVIDGIWWAHNANFDNGLHQHRIEGHRPLRLPP